MRFEIAADTDRGIVKETNQDSLLVKCFSTCKGDMAFAVLCDGMGGLSKGELASATVVRAFDRWSDEQLPELCKSSNPDIDSLILERQWDEVIQQQNEKIKAYGKAHAVNMGTTVVALLVTQKAYYIINVGDSRIYSLSDHIERLTTDQTYVQQGNYEWKYDTGAGYERSAKECTAAVCRGISRSKAGVQDRGNEKWNVTSALFRWLQA